MKRKPFGSGPNSKRNHAHCRLVLALAAEPNLSDRTYDALTQGLDNERIAGLLMVISFLCRAVQRLGVLQIDVEAACEKCLKEFPLAG